MLQSNLKSVIPRFVAGASTTVVVAMQFVFDLDSGDTHILNHEVGEGIILRDLVADEVTLFGKCDGLVFDEGQTVARKSMKYKTDAKSMASLKP